MASKKFSPKKFETEVVAPTLEEINKLMTVKGAEYSGVLDRLANFRKGAEDCGVTKETILLIYMNKHYDAIKTAIKDIQSGTSRKRSEPRSGRVDDMIVYLLLFKAMLVEGPDDAE